MAWHKICKVYIKDAGCGEQVNRTKRSNGSIVSGQSLMYKLVYLSHSSPLDSSSLLHIPYSSEAPNSARPAFELRYSFLQIVRN